MLKNFRVEIPDPDNSDKTITVTRTYLEVKEMRKAKASEYQNAGSIIGDWFRWSVIGGKKGKKTFGAQLIDAGGHILRAILV